MVWEEGPPSFFKATNSLRKTKGYNKKLIISGIFFLREEKNTILHIYSCIYIKFQLILINIVHHEEDNKENWERESLIGEKGTKRRKRQADKKRGKHRESTKRPTQILSIDF